MTKIRACIVGAGGYGGCGATELLINHPNDARSFFDKQDVKTISDLYPHLKGFCDLPMLDANDRERPRDMDVVFFATPDGVGQSEAHPWLDNGAKVIDYSGDFRFNDPETYRGYAQRIGKPGDHASPDLLPSAVYGLSELHRKEIAKSNLVGNPGCFAVSVILGLAPAIKNHLVDLESIICGFENRVSGAEKPSPFHYPVSLRRDERLQNFRHQHVYEIERTALLRARRFESLSPHMSYP
jgi:N-acetyl-gamma-glutamylphosphate reductase